MKQEKMEFYMIAIVGIVAIVGIILMTIGTQSNSLSNTNPNSNEDSAGKAVAKFSNYDECMNYCAGNDVAGELYTWCKRDCRSNSFQGEITRN